PPHQPKKNNEKGSPLNNNKKKTGGAGPQSPPPTQKQIIFFPAGVAYFSPGELDDKQLPQSACGQLYDFFF
ncbi:hypothetical protein ACNIS3_25760, partial [Escherichia coli]